MEDSTAATAVVAAPKTIVIERRWAIVGGALIAALVIGLGVALAIAAGDDGPDGPPGFRLSAHGAEGGYGPGFAPPGGTDQLPEGAPPMPPAPDGSYPPQGGVYPPPAEAVPAPPAAEGRGRPPSSQGGNGSGEIGAGPRTRGAAGPARAAVEG